MKLAEVSKTAILTLVWRALYDERNSLDCTVPDAEYCLAQLLSVSSVEEKKRILDLLHIYASTVRYSDVKAGAQRTAAIDGLVNAYVERNPGCTVVDLACGFDTRYWRVDSTACSYIELDLPEIIALKKELLAKYVQYEMIGVSVVDTSWIDTIASRGSGKFLFIAEGLFCYLPEADALHVLRTVAERFDGAYFVFDVTNRIFTRGIFRKLVRWSYRKYLDADTAWLFGLKQPRDLENLCPGYHIVAVQQTKRASTVIAAEIRHS